MVLIPFLTIDMIGVSKIVGSYTNVVGLPTEKTYQLLLPYLAIIGIFQQRSDLGGVQR